MSQTAVPESIPIRSIDSDDTHFGDLQPLADHFEGRDLVLLGERTHASGDAFRAKARVIQYLHRELGFTLLALEGGLYDCAHLDRALDSGASIADAMKLNLFGFFLGQSVADVLSYARATRDADEPLRICGVDCQIVARSDFSKEICERLRLAGMLNGESESALRRLVASTGAESLEGMDRDSVRHDVGSLLDSIDRGDLELEWVYLCVKGALAFEEIAANKASLRTPGPEMVRLLNLRDRVMAENLLWLMDRQFAGARVVAWLGTSHVARRLGSVEAEHFDYSRVMSMADHLFAALGSRMYSVAFTNFEGTLGDVVSGKSWPVVPPARGSLEDRLHRSGDAHVFVPIAGLDRGHELRRAITSDLLPYGRADADWGQVVDSIFHIDSAEPVVPLRSGS